MANPQLTSTAESYGNKVLSAIPIVGPFLSSIAGSIEGLFGAHHAAAVQREGQVLNSTTPTFVGNCVQIFSELNAGTITEQQAALHGSLVVEQW